MVCTVSLLEARALLLQVHSAFMRTEPRTDVPALTLAPDGRLQLTFLAEGRPVAYYLGGEDLEKDARSLLLEIVKSERGHPARR